MPAQEVAIAAYDDEAHVEENRALYRAKFDLADQIIGNRYGYKRPAGGFFLWLDVSRARRQRGRDAEALEGSGPARACPATTRRAPQADGFNPGEGYIRVAMVQDRETTAEALHRLVAVLGLERQCRRSATRSPPPTSSRTTCAPRCAAACTRSSASALLGVAGIAALALATWSVQDPSLSHATNAPVRNMLGLPGAIGADLMMQLLGIATIAFLFPVAAWGWRLLTHRPLDRERARARAVDRRRARRRGLCLVPAAEQGWPLPTGLGGVIGDALLRVPAWCSARRCPAPRVSPSRS